MKKVIELMKKCCNVFAKIQIKKCFSWSASIYARLGQNRTVVKAFWAIIFIAAFCQAILAISVYGFHLENNSNARIKPAVRTMVKIVPLPRNYISFDSVSYDRFLFERDYTDHFMTATNQQSSDSSWVDNEIMTMLTENKILYWQAFFHGVKTSRSDIDDAVDTIIAQSGGQEKVEVALKDYYGLTLKQFRVLVKDQLIREKLDENLIAKVTARHILVTVDAAATDEDVAAAKAKIDGYLAEINAGLDFSEAATKYSQDTGSAENGGYLEPFAYGEMVQAFSDAAFSANIGTVVGPIRTEFGWHLIKVESKTGTIKKQFSEWLAGLKDMNIIIPPLASSSQV